MNKKSVKTITTKLLCGSYIGLSILSVNASVILIKEQRVYAQQVAQCVIETENQAINVAGYLSTARGAIDATEVSVAEIEYLVANKSPQARQQLYETIADVDNAVQLFNSVEQNYRILEKIFNKCKKELKDPDAITSVKLYEEITKEFNTQGDRLKSIVKRLRKIKIVE